MQLVILRSHKINEDTMQNKVQCDVNEHIVSTVLGGVLSCFSLKDIRKFTDECKIFDDNRELQFNTIIRML
jgi:hypothetical protein